MKTTAKKATVAKPLKSKGSNRIPPLVLALGLTILLAGMPALPRVRINPRLSGSLWAAAGSLLILLLLFGARWRATDARCVLSFVP